MREKTLNTILVLLGGIAGSFIGEVLKRQVPLLAVFGETFSVGFTKPIYLDLHILELTFGFSFDINLMSIIGIVLVIIFFIKGKTK